MDTKKLRIGFLTPYYPPTVKGGMEISLKHLAETLAAEGHIVRVFTLRYGESTDATEGENPRIYRFAWRSDARLWPTRNPLAVRRLARQIRETHEPLDLLDAYSLFPHGIAAARALRIPVVVSVRDASVIDRATLHPSWDPPRAYLQKRVRRAQKFFPEILYALYGLYLREIDRKAIAAADLATFQSEALRSLLVGVFRRAAVIGSIAVRQAPEGSPPQVASVNFARDRVVLYAGRLGEGKGVGILLDAAHELLARGVPRLKFLFVGSGPLAAAIRATPFPSRVFFLGRHTPEETLKFARASAVVVVPSQIFENFPRMAIESIALGTPVVGTSAGGIPEAIGEAGVIVPPSDTAALAEGIRTTALDDGFRAQLLRKLPQQAVHFTPEAVTQRLLTAYGEILP